MSCSRALTVIASAGLIGFVTTAYALTLNVPQNMNVASAFDNLEDLGLVNTSLTHANVSSSGSSPSNLSLSVSTLGDPDYECSPNYGSPLPVACRFAQGDIPDSTRVVTFRHRWSATASDIPLPFGMFSGRKTEFASRFKVGS